MEKIDTLMLMKYLDTKFSRYKYIHIYGPKYLWYSKYKMGFIKINIHESLSSHPTMM